MSLNYNTILSIFINYYPELEKKRINKALISIFYPNYKRINDSDFTNEQLNAKRNLTRQVISAAENISYREACDNAKELQKIFKSKRINEKIKYVLLKVIDDDTSLDLSSPLLKNNSTLGKIKIFDFEDLIINIVVYAAINTKCAINVPFDLSKIDEYEEQGKKEVPHLFMKNDRSYLEIYKPYYEKAIEDISNVKTILYKQESVKFYQIYVAPDLATPVKIIRDETYRELKGYDASTNGYLSTFGKFTSITAPGGFGKSMFLKHLFLCDSLDYITPENRANVVPIFIQVRSFVKSEASLEQMLYKEISKYIYISFDVFINHLKEGGFLLLFDGLDEIKSSQLVSFFDELNTLTEKYPNNNYVTSSRPSEQGDCLRKFRVINLQGFKIERAKRMIKKLPNIDLQNKIDFCTLLDSGAYKKYNEIASNPLLLTLMFMVFMNKGKLPSKAYQFYEKAYEVLFYEHDSIKGYKDRIYHTQLKRLEFSKILSEFCFITTTTQDYEFTEAEIMQIISESSFADKVSPDDFIADLTDNLNLFYLENDKYHFVHRSFQEYFTANYCRLLPNKEFAKLPEWFDNLTNNRKHKGIPFYFTLCGYGVFRTLKDMNPERFLEYIVKPTVNELIEDDTLDGFLKFVDKAYIFIRYGVEVAMEPKSHLLKLILELYNGTYYADYSSEKYPEYSEYEEDGYWMTIASEDEPNEKLSEYDLNNILDRFIDEEEKEQWLTINRIDPDTPEFYDYSIPVIDIINNKDKFKELIMMIHNEKSELKMQFDKLIQYK